MPDTSIYRRVGDEVLVIELESGVVFYFNQAAEVFFDWFREPRSLEDFCAAFGVQENDEIHPLEEFSDFLLKNQILQKAAAAQTLAELPSGPAYARPVFLRKEPKVMEYLKVMCYAPPPPVAPPPSGSPPS